MREERARLITQYGEYVVGDGSREIPSSGHDGLKIELRPRDPDVGTFHTRSVAHERGCAGEGVALRGVGRERVGVLEATDDTWRNLTLEIGAWDRDPSPAIEKDDEPVLLHLDDRPERPVADVGVTRSLFCTKERSVTRAITSSPDRNERPATVSSGPWSVASAERSARARPFNSRRSKWCSAVIALHRRSGSATRSASLRIPGAGEEVVGLVDGLGFGDAAIAPQPLERLGDLSLPVLGVGETDLCHLLALLAIEVGEGGCLVGVVFREVSEDPAGRDRRVLGGIPDEAEDRARLLGCLASATKSRVETRLASSTKSTVRASMLERSPRSK